MISKNGKRVGRPPRNESGSGVTTMSPMIISSQPPAYVPPPTAEPVAEEIPLWRSPGPVRRFTADMIDDWLLGRLEKVWPGHSRVWWRGIFLGFAASNDYLCICNDRAVLVAYRFPQPLEPKPIVIVRFCWSRDADGDWLSKDKAQPMFDLYNHCRRWLTDMNGERMLLGLCDDLRGDVIVRQWLDWRNVEGIPVVDARPYRSVENIRHAR